MKPKYNGIFVIILFSLSTKDDQGNNSGIMVCNWDEE